MHAEAAANAAANGDHANDDAANGGANGHANGAADGGGGGGVDLPQRPFQRLSKAQVQLQAASIEKADSAAAAGAPGDPKTGGDGGGSGKSARAAAAPWRWNRTWALNEVAWLRGVIMQVKCLRFVCRFLCFRTLHA